MKLNLLLDDPGAARSGHTNIDPAAPEGDADRVKGEWGDLTPWADPGEVTGLVALDALGYVGRNEAEGVLGHWASMLAHGGTLTVSLTDPLEVARAVVERQLPWPEACTLLMGPQDPGKPWKVRRTAWPLGRLVELVRGLGLKVLRRQHVDYRALVVAQRP